MNTRHKKDKIPLDGNVIAYDFHKYHALGNDYIVIDPNNTKLNVIPENIKLICHRHFGIGSDGILYGPILEKDNLPPEDLQPRRK